MAPTEISASSNARKFVTEVFKLNGRLQALVKPITLFSKVCQGQVLDTVINIC